MVLDEIDKEAIRQFIRDEIQSQKEEDHKAYKERLAYLKKKRVEMGDDVYLKWITEENRKQGID